MRALRLRAVSVVAWALLTAMAGGPAAATDLVASPLAGAVWRVIAIDGRAVVGLRADEGGEHPVRFTFGWRGYGGNAGCNAMGGLYAQVGDRLYTMPGPQTAMACSGPQGAQEEAANALLSASPTVVRGRDSILLSGGGHTMELARAGPAPDNADPPGPWQGSALSGQNYAIHEVNGVRTEGMRLWKNPPRLRFGSGEVRMTLDCPKPAKGVFNQSTEHLYAALLDPVCSEPRDRALSAILGADPRVVSGPNGELLLASAKGWAILWNERRDRPK